jgi:glycerophosphoryl diester phosphodiesterase
MQAEPVRLGATGGPIDRHAAVMERPYLRIGHKGAAALAPENTIPSLAAAIALGVDMVEFDVVDAAGGTLVLAHSHEEIEPGAPTLEEALAFLAAQSPPSLQLDLDLKSRGFEQRAVEALRRHGLVDRSIACSFFPASLRELRRCEPRLRTGLSYPWDRRSLATRRALSPLVPLGAAALRTALPLRIARMVHGARAGSAMLHYSVVSAPAVARCHARGITVFAWTVDDEAVLERVLAAGVDGVITNDPRIFGAATESR